MRPRSGHRRPTWKGCARRAPYYRSSYVFVTRARRPDSRLVQRSRSARHDDRRPARRRRRLEHPAGARPGPARARRQRARLLALRRLQPAEPAGPDRRSRCGRRRSTPPWPGGPWPAISPRARRCRLRHAGGAADRRAALPMVWDISMAVRKEDEATAAGSRCGPRPPSRRHRRHPGAYGVPRLDRRLQVKRGGPMRRLELSCSVRGRCSCRPANARSAPSVRRTWPARSEEKIALVSLSPGPTGPVEARSGRGARIREQRLPSQPGQEALRWFNCSGCHGNGGGGSGPPLMDDIWIYGGEHREHRRDDPRGPAERHAVVPRQGAGRPDLGDSPPTCAP